MTILKTTFQILVGVIVIVIQSLANASNPQAEMLVLDGDVSPIHDPAIIREGANYSTYKILVGRSKEIRGPYKDRDGKPMMEGGGTLMLEGSPEWRGPGGQSVLLDSAADLLVFHAYNGTTGKAALQISTMVWKNGWPRAGVLAGAATVANSR